MIAPASPSISAARTPEEDRICLPAVPETGSWPDGGVVVEPGDSLVAHWNPSWSRALSAEISLREVVIFAGPGAEAPQIEISLDDHPLDAEVDRRERAHDGDATWVASLPDRPVVRPLSGQGQIRVRVTNRSSSRSVIRAVAAYGVPGASPSDDASERDHAEVARLVEVVEAGRLGETPEVHAHVVSALRALGDLVAALGRSSLGDHPALAPALRAWRARRARGPAVVLHGRSALRYAVARGLPVQRRDFEDPHGDASHAEVDVTAADALAAVEAGDDSDRYSVCADPVPESDAEDPRGTEDAPRGPSPTAATAMIEAGNAGLTGPQTVEERLQRLRDHYP